MATMEILSETNEKGVLEQRFDLKVGSEVVPGIRWRPAGGSAARPTVLIGHGGTQHKRIANVLGLARRLVRHHGYGAVALDAPGHGERIRDPEAAERRRQSLETRLAAGVNAEPRAFTAEEASEWAERTTRGGAEWPALLDELDAEGGAAPYGYWGLSMGTAIGLPASWAWPDWGTCPEGTTSNGRPGPCRSPSCSCSSGTTS
jgi:alpha-beta hydrolase superfamily lysophospholipase